MAASAKFRRSLNRAARLFRPRRIPDRSAPQYSPSPTAPPLSRTSSSPLRYPSRSLRTLPRRAPNPNSPPRSLSLGHRRNHSHHYHSSNSTKSSSSTRNHSAKQHSPHHHASEHHSPQHNSSEHLRRPWSSGGPSLFARRNHSSSWSRMFASSRDLRERPFHSTTSHRASSSWADLHLPADVDIVEIGRRLPDRSYAITNKDVFGRRRSDISPSNLPTLPSENYNTKLNNNTSITSDQTPNLLHHRRTHFSSSSPSLSPSLSPTSPSPSPQQPLPPSEPPFDRCVRPLFPDSDTLSEHDAIRHITKAIDSSKGRLRKSANMSRAFTSAIRNPHGLLRNSEIVQQTLSSEHPQDPSVIILLDPDAVLKSSASSTSSISSSASDDRPSSIDANPALSAPRTSPLGFSTSMTARQCAATLETILRDMACHVFRAGEHEIAKKRVITLKATRTLPSSNPNPRILQRKLRIAVVVREEDRIRTSVSFRRVHTFWGTRDAHLPLCAQIRERFQREWPAVVEALYIRVPTAHLVAAG